MKYFCYISERKVDMLLQQIDASIIDETTEEEILERQKSVNAGVGGLLGLFSLGASFGKSNRVGVSRTHREGVVQKLRRAVIGLAAIRDLPDLAAALQRSEPMDSVYYYYEGQFRVASHDQDMARLRSPVSSLYTVELACSMRYFSDLQERNGRLAPHSGNIAFFEGSMSPTFSGIVVVGDVKDTVVHGSPVYLALEPVQSLNL